MESDGAVTIFKRAEEKYGLQYAEFLGEADSKAFTSVKEMVNPNIRKFEYTGHIQNVWAKLF